MAGGGAGAAAVASAVGSFASPIIGGAFTLGGIALQHKYNKELAAIQNQYNIDMWRMNNEYNSPQAQMQRYEEAGLNPNLIYSQGNPGNSASAPVQVAPEPVRIDKGMAEIGKMFNVANIMKSWQEIRNLKADADAKEITNAEARDLRNAKYDISQLYDWDPESGLYKWHNQTGDVTVTRMPNLYERMLKNVTGAITTRGYHFNNLLSENFRRNKLITQRYNYLAPQIELMNWQNEHKERNYWIGTGLKAWQNLNGTIGNFVPSKMFVRPGSVNPYSSNPSYNPYLTY